MLYFYLFISIKEVPEEINIFRGFSFRELYEIRWARWKEKYTQNRNTKISNIIKIREKKGNRLKIFPTVVCINEENSKAHLQFLATRTVTKMKPYFFSYKFVTQKGKKINRTKINLTE